METKNNYSFGGGFLSLLTVLFIGLKLGEVGVVATWSWWWVLSPLWIPIVLVLGVLATILVILTMTSIISKLTN